MSVTAARGFRAAGVVAGLKPSGRPDVAVVINDGPQWTAAGVFTTNRFCAAPVQWSRAQLGAGRARAVIINSGNANACTGPGGWQDTVTTATQVAAGLGAQPEEIVVCSTGLIGERLDMPALTAGVDAAIAQASSAGAGAAAEAILTTDTVSKQALRHGEGYVVGGMAKGVGMLNPALATMLVVLTTDAIVPPPVAALALRLGVATTFNRLDSDGCMSTNDTVVLMASGASGIEVDPGTFAALVREVCADLASQLLADAEGSSHDIAVVVRGATSESAAVEVARAITSSNLVKAAIFGQDPNWGRILAAVGTVPVEAAPFDPGQVDVTLNGVMVATRGGVGADRNLVDLSGRQVELVVDLHAGEASATVWTNDLTYEYVRENSEYST